MKRDDRDVLAAEYVLGTLDDEARERVARQMLQDPALQHAVDTWAARLADLDDGEARIEPPAGLWDKIDAALDSAAPTPFSITLRAAEGQWDEIVDGIHKKILFVDRDAGTVSFLLRFAPGAVLPSHPHSRTEECVMLEGDATVGDLRLVAGDYHAVSAGVPHPEIHSEAGALVYVRGELREAAG